MISSTLTSELAKVNDWLVDNSLFIQQGKTECVIFGTGSRLATAYLSLNIDGKGLTWVAEYKYLGVILDESLSWNAHVNYLISKVSKRIGILGRTRRSISMHTAGKFTDHLFFLFLIIVIPFGTNADVRMLII